MKKTYKQHAHLHLFLLLIIITRTPRPLFFLPPPLARNEFFQPIYLYSSVTRALWMQCVSCRHRPPLVWTLWGFKKRQRGKKKKKSKKKKKKEKSIFFSASPPPPLLLLLRGIRGSCNTWSHGELCCCWPCCGSQGCQTNTVSWWWQWWGWWGWWCWKQNYGWYVSHRYMVCLLWLYSDLIPL